MIFQVKSDTLLYYTDIADTMVYKCRNLNKYTATRGRKFCGFSTVESRATYYIYDKRVNFFARASASPFLRSCWQAEVKE